MNESILTEGHCRASRPTRRASTSRKRKMREELLAHVGGVFAVHAVVRCWSRMARLAHGLGPSGAVPFAGMLAACSGVLAWGLAQSFAERRRYHEEWGACRSRYLRRADDHAGYPPQQPEHHADAATPANVFISGFSALMGGLAQDKINRDSLAPVIEVPGFRGWRSLTTLSPDPGSSTPGTPRVQIPEEVTSRLLGAADRG